MSVFFTIHPEDGEGILQVFGAGELVLTRFSHRRRGGVEAEVRHGKKHVGPRPPFALRAAG